ncbi:unnamed protein product [Albugo candida]|uniref:TATA box binding protein associated factor (TAF) histone-like fold domain-containing protein n=2 Tax=Albugo candida TaxID=65357 RepID=A0A024G338_9STRA|nr:unnamed protein product [Albugo candida]|eukprot:CCI40729.1 unnamed protein product [Albugo candida]
MSVLRQEMIQVIAQSLGFDDLSEESMDDLLPEVEVRVREIIQDAIKFRNHAKRRKLSTRDINQALQARHLEPLYGFQSCSLDHAIIPLKSCKEQSSLYFYNEQEWNVQELLEAVFPPIPIEPCVRLHWLAIDGVQPQIPENECSHSNKDSDSTSMQHEDQQTDRKPLVKHVLTEEMQVFYSKLTEAIKQQTDLELQRAAFHSISQDPGMRQLLPYVSRFVYQEVKNSNRDLAILVSLMRVCRCLLVNPHLRIELYLHQLLPALLSCVLGHQLCENAAENHWALRDHAAQLIATICKKYGETYAKLQARVSKTYHLAISDPHCPFSTQYGAINGLMYLGPLVMEKLLFPNLPMYYKRLEPALNSSNPDLIQRLEAQNCLGTLVHASGMYFDSQMETVNGNDEAAVCSFDTTVSILYEAFGERLVPYMALATIKNVPVSLRPDMIDIII